MSETRKLRIQPPPNGFVWIEDYRADDGSAVLPGIARRLGISSSTYRKWRMRGEGPPTVVIGKKVAARIESIENYLRGLERLAQMVNAAEAEASAHDMRPAESRFQPAA